MAKRRSRLKERIELRRQKGQSPAKIARYVHPVCHSCWSKKFPWTPHEREELERLDRDVAARNAERDRKTGKQLRPLKLLHAKKPYGGRYFPHLPSTWEEGDCHERMFKKSWGARLLNYNVGLKTAGCHRTAHATIIFTMPG